MASDNAGAIYVEIRAALDKLQADINKSAAMFKQIEGKAKPPTEKIPNMFEKMGKDVGKSLTNMSNTGIGQFAKMAQGMQAAIMSAPVIGMIMMVVGAITKAVKGFLDNMKENTKVFIEQQKEVAKLNAVIQSTGAIAWTTTRQMKGMAKELSAETGRSVKDIMEMQSVLLGFKNVTGESFDRATKAIVDMSAVMGGDLKGAANSVGKALDTPIEGMSALSRQGFVFTQQEKAMVAELVKTGKVLEAQDVILRAMEDSFAGVASSMNAAEQAASRLNAAEERLAAARGERDSRHIAASQNRRAARKEERAEEIEFQNAVRNAKAADYSEQITQIEALSRNYQKAAEEVSRLNALKDTGEWSVELEISLDEAKAQEITSRNMKITAELELDRKEADDQLVLLKNEMNDFFISDTHNSMILEEARKNGEELSKVLYEIARTEGYLSANQQAYVSQLASGVAVQETILKNIDGQIERQQAFAEAHMQNMRNEEADNEQLRLQREAINEIEQQRIKLLEEIERAEKAGLQTAEEAKQARANAYKTEADAINQIMSNAQRLKLTSESAIRRQKEMMDDLNKGLNEATGNYRRLHEEIAAGPRRITAAQFGERLSQIETALRNNENALQEMRRTGLINEKEYQDQLLQARQASANSAQQLLRETGVMERGNEGFYARIRALDAVADKETELAKERETAEKALKDRTKYEQGLQDKLEELKATESQLIEIEIRRSWEKIEQSGMLIGLTEDEIEALKRLNEEVIRLEKNDKGVSENFKKVMEKIQQYGSAIGNALSGFADLRAAMIQKEVDEELKAQEKIYKTKLDYLEKEKQAKLYAKGFIEAQTEEQHQRELELAIESGDQQRIYAAHSNHEKFLIEEEFANAKEALDQQTAEKKAQLEYKAALATWESQLLQAIVSAAMATIGTLSQPPYPPWNLGLVALTAGLGAAQIGVVSANKPKMQTFAEGGIVSGNSFRGDNVLVRANSGEMILDQRKQKNMLNAIDNNELGEGQKVYNIITAVNLDGREICRNTVTYINNGAELIKQRSVVK